MNVSVDDRKLISIICPVYNEEKTIPLFYDRLQRAIAPLRESYDFELIFTNNRSTDHTLESIGELHRQDSSVHVITFSRNFGYQASVLAGLKHAVGDAMVVIDVDCEDPPELIPLFVAGWEDGHDITFGVRGNRPESRVLLAARRLFYRLNRLMADNEVILDMAEFSLISAHVRDAMVENDSTFPFLRTEIGYAGFRRVGIPYDRQMRIFGHSHYNLFRMVTFAIGGILSSSTFLLRLAAYIVPVLIVANIILGILVAWYGSALTFRLLVMLDLMYLLAFTSVLSVYVARIYKDGVNRPIFIVDWQLSELGQPSRRPPRKMWTTHRKIRTPDAGTRSGNHVFTEGRH